jgi:hypothetical protein
MTNKDFKYPWWKNVLRGIVAVLECLTWAFKRPSPPPSETENWRRMDADNDAYRFKSQNTGRF